MSSESASPKPEEISRLSIAESIDKEIEPYDFESRDVHATMIGLTPLLVAKARYAARHYSESNTGLIIGAAGFAVDTSDSSPRIGIFTSGNYAKIYSPDPLDLQLGGIEIPQITAEMDIITRASNLDFERIGMIVLAATTRPTRVRKAMNGAPAKTIDPSQETDALMGSRNLIDADTIILSVGSGTDIYKAQRYIEFTSRYKRFRETGKFIDAPVQRYSPYIWEIKRALYEEEVIKSALAGSVYDEDRRKEEGRRSLAALAVQTF